MSGTTGTFGTLLHEIASLIEGYALEMADSFMGGFADILFPGDEQQSDEPDETERGVQ